MIHAKWMYIWFSLLTSIDNFFTDADSGNRVLLYSDDALVLEAEANADAVYKFYYREAGTDKWRPIATKYVVENQAHFRPKTEGAYEFKVEATAVDRKAKASDVSAELSEPINIWFTALPAKTIDLTVVDDDNDYIIGLDDEMNLQVDLTGNEDNMEVQVVYSTNNGKSY